MRVGVSQPTDGPSVGDSELHSEMPLASSIRCQTFSRLSSASRRVRTLVPSAFPKYRSFHVSGLVDIDQIYRVRGVEFDSMATYAEIAECVKQQSGFTPKTCWIAHVKELNGLRPRVAPNRTRANVRQVPCPLDKREAIEECLRRLRMI